MATKYEVTFSQDGITETFKRTSADRQYTHAVSALRFSESKRRSFWAKPSFCGSFDLAQKTASRQFLNGVIAPVTIL